MSSPRGLLFPGLFFWQPYLLFRVFVSHQTRGAWECTSVSHPLRWFSAPDKAQLGWWFFLEFLTLHFDGRTSPEPFLPVLVFFFFVLPFRGGFSPPAEPPPGTFAPAWLSGKTIWAPGVSLLFFLERLPFLPPSPWANCQDSSSHPILLPPPPGNASVLRSPVGLCFLSAPSPLLRILPILLDLFATFFFTSPL